MVIVKSNVDGDTTASTPNESSEGDAEPMDGLRSLDLECKV